MRDMYELSKTLGEMTPRELSNMMAVVVNSLEVAAEEAAGYGDAQFAVNSIAVAQTLRGCTAGSSVADLRSAELLLEQGISLMNSYRKRWTGLDAIN